MEFEPKGCSLEALQPVIDAFVERACVLDESGIVLTVNAAWRAHTPAGNAECDGSPDAACSGEPSFSETSARINIAGKTHFILWRHDRADADSRASNMDFQRQLALREAQIRQLNAEAEAFNYSVSHDLEGPARRARHFCALIAEDRESVLSPRAAHCLARIEANAGHMLQNLQGLAALSRVDRHELVRSRCDLSAIAKEVAESLQAEGLHPSIAVTISPDLQAYADPHLVRILFDRLIGNALKFTARTPNPAVQVAAQLGARGSVFCVHDNGMGFDMKHAAKLFRPFQRLHSAEEFAGSGMGLNVARQIVRRHGGEIWAEGAPNEGASFYFTLGPAQASPSSAAEQATPSPERTTLVP